MNRFEPENYEVDDESDDRAPVVDVFSAALALCQVAANPKNIAAAVKKLARLEKNIATASEVLARLQAQSAAILGTAKAEAEKTRANSAEREEGLAAREQQLAERERHISRLENAWRNVGEPAEVWSGFKSPEHTPLAKARAARGLPPIAEPDGFELQNNPEELTRDQFEAMDPDYARADPKSGQVDVAMPQGAAGMTRTFANKPRREARQ
jgi:hypothetical protein